MNKTIESAVNWAVSIAKDDSHGYDQIGRWGPDYDCSSLVISAWEQAGVPVKEAGATYTGNMKAAFEKCGFKSISTKKSFTLIRGDVLLNEAHHTAMYIGDGKVVQATSNEKGGIYNGKDGDQTGKEIAISPYYVYRKGWDCVLRYMKEDEEVKTVDISMPVLQKGAKCAEVGTLQTLLNALGYVGSNGKKLTVDHDFGSNCDYAVRNFQKAHGMNADGIVGAKTWNALMRADY